MKPAQITDVIEGILEDHLDELVPAPRLREVAKALTESWLKDRGRAVKEALQ
jgi:hypothetical protein